MCRATYRLPDGRQVKRTIGLRARSAGGCPPAKRTAEAWLRDVLAQARSGTLPGMVRTGVTCADACEEYLHYVEVDLDRKPSTLTDYRSIIRAHLLPAFGVLRLRVDPPALRRRPLPIRAERELRHQDMRVELRITRP